MVSKLKEELKQKSDFGSLEEEVTLSIARTAEFMMTAIAAVLKPSDLTVTQYNALRILRGAGPDGLMCGEVGERMVTKESDVTRLLDRLEARGLISRNRPPENRRVVMTTITKEGRELLDKLAPSVGECNERLSSALSAAEKRSLIAMLESIRTSQ